MLTGLQIHSDGTVVDKFVFHSEARESAEWTLRRRGQWKNRIQLGKLSVRVYD